MDNTKAPPSCGGPPKIKLPLLGIFTVVSSTGEDVVGATVIEFRPNGELLAPVAPLNVGAFSVTVDSTTGAVTVQ